MLNWLLGEASVGITVYLPIQYKWTYWEVFKGGFGVVMDKRIQNHSMDTVKKGLAGL